MRPKTINPDEFSSSLKNPGPGAYETYKTITDKGKLFVSKYHSSGCTTFNPAHSKRFNTRDTMNVPGPGHYSYRSV